MHVGSAVSWPVSRRTIDIYSLAPCIIAIFTTQRPHFVYISRVSETERFYCCAFYSFLPVMSLKAQETPVRDPDEIILCIEDLKKAAAKKLPHGIKGENDPMS